MALKFRCWKIALISANTNNNNFDYLIVNLLEGDGVVQLVLTGLRIQRDPTRSKNWIKKLGSQFEKRKKCP